MPHVFGKMGGLLNWFYRTCQRGSGLVFDSGPNKRSQLKRSKTKSLS